MEKVSGFEKTINTLDKLLEYFAIAMIGCSVLLAFVSVILRYVLGISYEILTEISIYTIVYGVFFYMGPLIRQNEHIKMSALHEILKGKVLLYIDLLINVILALTFAFLIYGGYKWSSSLLDMKVKTLSGGMLLFIPALAIIIGMIIALIYSLLEITRNIKLISNG
ncbi:TRAP transporter small permease subunit [Sporosarcina sp. 179-K 3D1 HS]|uniref:TRAP transporter small permease n=1 Tax=Sporosarcina sp. 179-K 3D1 HS TaxID=3232169 RepID=UPI0039A00A38